MTEECVTNRGVNRRECDRRVCYKEEGLKGRESERIRWEEVCV